MSDRYIKVYAAEENMYSEGSPVVITAGALLKDSKTGNILAQLKLRNIGAKEIKAVKLAVIPCDAGDMPIGDVVEYYYLDLESKRGQYFGEKNAVDIPNRITRAYNVEVREVIFADKSRWTAASGPWEPLPKQKVLSDLIGAELKHQFAIKFGGKCEYEPTAHKDLWFCACGEINGKDEELCHSCGKNFDDMTAVTIAQLQQELDERLEQERLAAEAAALAERIRRKKRTKRLVVATAAVALVVAAALTVPDMVRYGSAKKLMESGQYEQAITAFEAMEGYRDSEEHIHSCEYAIAASLMEAGQFEDAISAFEALGDYMDSAAQIEKCNIGILDREYDNAVSLMGSDPNAAYEAFLRLKGYKDSAEKAEFAAKIYMKQSIASAAVGKYIYFGSYEQDNDESNGAERIEWLVLDIQDGRALVVSRYALECQLFNNSYTEIIWKNSSLRNWLNHVFLSYSFSELETGMIATTNTATGAEDRVFLLSTEEIETYFTTAEARRCEATQYAISRGVYVEDSWCWWWTRDNGVRQNTATAIDCNGEMRYGVCVNEDSVAVRPAMWINLNA